MIFVKILAVFSIPLELIIKFLFNIKIDDKIAQCFIGIISIIFLSFIITYLLRSLRERKILINEKQKIITLQKNNEIFPEDREEFKKISEKCRIFSRIIMPYKDKLYATQDVESKAEEIWSPNILHSKIFPTVAAILTGCGVLGTFVGLLIGLKGLNLGGSMEQLQGEIQRVADGASIAFMTSVCGVFLSLIFTLVEKYVSGIIANALKDLQEQLAKIFEPLPIMQVFTEMNTAAQSSKDVLGGLAEQIGSRMQETLNNSKSQIIEKLTDTIEELQSSKNILGDIPEQISGRMQDALNNSMSQLIEKLSKEIGNLRESAQNTLGESIKNTLGMSIDKLEYSLQQMTEIFKNQTGKEFDKVSDALKIPIQQFIDKLNEVGNAPSKAIKDAADRMGNKTDEMKNEIANFANIISEINNISTIIGDFIQKFDKYKDNTDRLYEFITNDFKNLVDSINNAGKSLSTSSENLKEFGSEINKSTQIVKESANSVKEISKYQNEATTRLDSISSIFESGVLETISSNFKESSKSFSDSVKISQQSFGELSVHYSELQEKLVNQISILLNKFTHGLNDTGAGLSEPIKIATGEMGVQINNLKDLIGSINSAHESINIFIEKFNEYKDNTELLYEFIANDLPDLAISINNAGGSLFTSSTNLKEFGSEINKSTQIVKYAADSIKEISKYQNEATIKIDTVSTKVDSIGNTFEKICTDFGTISQSFNSSAEKSQQSFIELSEHYSDLLGEISNHYDEFHRKLSDNINEFKNQEKEHIKELDEHMRSLLEEYAKELERYANTVKNQTTIRMSEWDKQTKDFCERMTTTVLAMQEIIDEIGNNPKKS